MRPKACSCSDRVCNDPGIHVYKKSSRKARDRYFIQFVAAWLVVVTSVVPASGDDLKLVAPAEWHHQGAVTTA